MLLSSLYDAVAVLFTLAPSEAGASCGHGVLVEPMNNISTYTTLTVLYFTDSTHSRIDAGSIRVSLSFSPHSFSDDEVEVTVEGGIEGEANGGANKGFD